MRIALKDGNGTLWWLAGEPAVAQNVHSWADQLRINGEIVFEWIDLLRATVSQAVDRGNLKTVVTFSTTRRFSTPRAAQLYCADYDRSTPRRGILVLEGVGPDGSTNRRYMGGAVVMPPHRQAIGCSVLLNYEVRGGLIVLGEDGEAEPGDTWEDAVGLWEAGGG